MEQFVKSSPLKNKGSFNINDENVPRGTFLEGILKISLVLGIIHAFLGILQILAQKSIGLFWLKESIISADMTGVAKVIFNGETWVRAYGLFPHPNVLGGFLVFTTICTIMYYKLFHPSTIVPRGTIYGAGVEQFVMKKQDNCSTWNNLDFQKEKSTVLFSNCSTWNNSVELDGRNISQRKKCSTWNIFGYERGTLRDIGNMVMFYVEQSCNKPLFKRLIIAVQILAIILSFSKSAILGLIIAILYVKHESIKITNPLEQRNCSTWNNLANESQFNVSRQEKCSTWNIFRGEWMVPSRFGYIIMFHVEHFVRKTRHVLRHAFSINKKAFLISAIIFLIFVFIKPNYDSLVGRSVSDRFIFLNVSRETFFEHPVLGIGAGQYVINLLNRRDVLEWQYEPVHNVFLLMLNELGIAALSLFLFFVYKLFHVEQFERLDAKIVPRGTMRQDIITAHIKGILLALLVISLLDHYPWTIQQGQVIIWLSLAMLAANGRRSALY